LIPLIDDPTPVPFDLMDPKWSNIPAGHNYHPACGIMAAYMIEVILGREAFDSTPGPWFLGGNPGNYVHATEDLWDSSTGSPATTATLPAFKAQYANWWKKNHEISLDELRKSWRERRYPLANSQFFWR
ncbi:MAG TPA: hypothetical protein VGJ21_07515, partial [Terracidiphilus sp.]